MWNFWFSFNPPPLSGNMEALWGAIALACVAASIAVRRFVLPRVTIPAYRQPWRRAARLAVTTGIVLFVLLFFRSERIPFFGARLWVLVLLLADLAWGITIVREVMVKIPTERKAWEVEQQKRKYLR